MEAYRFMVLEDSCVGVDAALYKGESPDFVNAYPKIHQRIAGRCVDGVS